MSTGKSDKAAKPEAPDLKAIAKEWSGRKNLSGSDSGHFTLALVNQVWRSQWIPEGTPEWIMELGRTAAMTALKGIAPCDPTEGMLATQMVATHEAAMECFRRAALPEQSFEGRQAALGQANKLVRSYTALLEALDKHRGKGQPQVVRVERVTVEAGGQAIVGNVTKGAREGGGGEAESSERSHAPAALAHEPGTPLWGSDPDRQPVPVAGGKGQTTL